MNCDNTICNNKSKKYYDCLLTSDFNNETCRWCENCLNRDKDMIKSYIRVFK